MNNRHGVFIVAGTAIGLILSTSLATAEAPATERAPYNVHDFGAKGDGEADDTPAINHAIAVAMGAGPGATIVIPTGRYRLEAQRGKYELLSIHRAEGLTIRGEPGTVLIAADPDVDIFAVQGTRNVRLLSLTLEQEKSWFTQGTISAIDPKGMSCEITIDSGFDPPDSGTVSNCTSFRPFLYDGTTAYAPERHFRQIKFRKKISEGKWRVTLEGHALEPELKDKNFLIWDDRHRGHAIAGGNNQDLLVEDVTYYGKGTAGMFSINSGRGESIFRRCIASVPPDSHAWLSCAAGGVFSEMRGALVFDSCVFEKIDDDAADVFTHYVRVLSQTDAHTLVLQRNLRFEPGDVLAVVDWNRKSERSTAKIVTVTSKADHSCTVALDRDVEIRRTGAGDGKLISPDARGDGIDRVIDYSLACQSAVFRNCRMQSLRARAINLKAQNCVIEGCTFFDCEMPAIAAGPELSWGEGPAVRNLTIRNNQFKRCNADNIDIDCFDAEKECNALDNRNIVIEGDTFENYGAHATAYRYTPGCAIHIKNAEGVVVRGNIFGAQGAGAAKDVGKVIVERSKNVSFARSEGLPESAIQRK